MTSYLIERITKPVERTHWWKDLNGPRPADVWWLSGHGLSRPATDVEVALWQQAGARALELVMPFTEFVNVTASGGTPEDVLKKEFGL